MKGEVTKRCKVCKDFTKQEVFLPTDANNFIMYKCMECDNFEKKGN